VSRTVTPEPTPNPNATRFSLGEDALGGASISFANAEAAAGTPWAEQLFEIAGVVSLFGVKDFVTVTKEPHTGWEAIVPHVVEVLENAAF
jgi:hypothetical protein